MEAKPNTETRLFINIFPSLKLRRGSRRNASVQQRNSGLVCYAYFLGMISSLNPQLSHWDSLDSSAAQLLSECCSPGVSIGTSILRHQHSSGPQAEPLLGSLLESWLLDSLHPFV